MNSRIPLLERLEAYANAGYGHSETCEDARAEIERQGTIIHDLKHAISNLDRFKTEVAHVLRYNPNANDCCGAIEAKLVEFDDD